MIRSDEDELQRMEDEQMESILFAANMENDIRNLKYLTNKQKLQKLQKLKNLKKKMIY